MKKLLSGFLLFAALANSISLHAQVAPSISWQKSLGGTLWDEAWCIQQTSDGGFIVAGYSSSDDGNVSGKHYGSDYWIVKLNSDGNIAWQKCLGGSAYDYAEEVQQTTDGGFIVVGTSGSNNGDVTGNHGTLNWLGDTLLTDDYWVVKLDADGNLIWQKSLGGSSTDWARSVQQTTDAGFIIGGESRSNNGDVSGNHHPNYWTNSADYWIVKLDADGNLMWQKCLGGSGDDFQRSLRLTADGGFIVAGRSWSNNGDVSGNHGNGGSDGWMAKLDSTGNIEWQKCLGGTLEDRIHSVEQTAAGGFIVAGSSQSNDGDVSEPHGCDTLPYCPPDYWIVKLDSIGNLIWQKSLGGSNDDYSYSIQQTTDGGFITAGVTRSNDGDVSGNYGLEDYWIIKLDTAGNIKWQKSLGGSSTDWANSIKQTTDGGYVIAGSSQSTDGIVSGNQGEKDYWIVKLTSDSMTDIGPPLNHFISVYPNPVQTQFIINIETPANEVTIRVYDVQGKIRQTALSVQTDKIILNTENLPAGFYTLQITDNKTGESEKGKFIKL